MGQPTSADTGDSSKVHGWTDVGSDRRLLSGGSERLLMSMMASRSINIFLRGSWVNRRRLGPEITVRRKWKVSHKNNVLRTNPKIPPEFMDEPMLAQSLIIRRKWRASHKNVRIFISSRLRHTNHDFQVTAKNQFIQVNWQESFLPEELTGFHFLEELLAPDTATRIHSSSTGDKNNVVWEA
jgi:hypothetical protein